VGKKTTTFVISVLVIFILFGALLIYVGVDLINNPTYRWTYYFDSTTVSNAADIADGKTALAAGSVISGTDTVLLIWYIYLKTMGPKKALRARNKFAQLLKMANATVISSDPLSENETIIMQESKIKQFDTESPPSMGFSVGMGRTLDLGTLILTNKKLIYVSLGANEAMALTKTISQAEVNYLMKYKRSYFVPLLGITRVETNRIFATSYLRVDNRISGQKNYHSYNFLVQYQKESSGNVILKAQAWANAINSAIATARSGQTAPKYCTRCGKQLPEGKNEVCPYCGNTLLH
jgi:hypothetical protein